MSTTIKKAEATSKTHLNNIMQIAIFSLNDGKYYGINVSKIRSFEDYKKYKKVKNDTIDSPYLDGYIQYHNGVVPIINIEKWLGMFSESSQFYEYMVCEYNKHMVAFPISGINNIFNIPITDLQTPDAMFSDIITYNAVVEIDGREEICLVLDVEKLIIDTFGSTETESLERYAISSKKEVLVAEDSKAARAIIETILQSTELKFRIFEDGLAIIEYLDKLDEAQIEEVGIIVTDLEMPKRDGYQVLRHISDTKRLAAIPVVVNTSMSDAGVERKVLDLGAKGFIPKTDPETFLDLVKQHIR